MVYADERKDTPFSTRDVMLDIRAHLTELGFRGFGKKSRKMPKIPENWEEWSDASRDKWIKTQERKLEFTEQCDRAFIADEFHWFNETTRTIVDLIDRANTLNPQTEHEWEIQRDMQNEAIGLCSNLKRELNHIAATIPCNINFATAVTKEIDREIELLKGWRRSCVPIREKVI